MLRRFIVHLEGRASGPRVGLSPKLPRVNATEQMARRASGCAARSQCVGQQRYVAALNSCEQPVCSTFFQQLDAPHGVCVWRHAFKVIVGLVLGVLGGGELLLQALHVWVPSRYLKEANDPSPSGMVRAPRLTPRQ